MACIGRVIVHELCLLCSDKQSSILSSRDVKQLMNLDWSTVIQEAKKVMSVLFKLLSLSTTTYTAERVGNRDAIIGLIISILVKQRRPTSSLFQKIVSLIIIVLWTLFKEGTVPVIINY